MFGCFQIWYFLRNGSRIIKLKVMKVQICSITPRFDLGII